MRYRIRYLENDLYTASTEDGRIVFVDGRESEKRKYYSPTELLLIAAGGCTLIDVEHILKKMRQEFLDVMVSIEGKRRDGYPRIFEYVDIEYHIAGDVDHSKVIRAVELSISKYCSILQTLNRAGAKINYKVIVNEREIYSNRV